MGKSSKGKGKPKSYKTIYKGGKKVIQAKDSKGNVVKQVTVKK